MSRYSVLASFIFLLLATKLPAQEYTFKLDTVLHPVKQASYGKLRVIDMRADKGSLTEPVKSKSGRGVSIVAERPLPELLSAYYSRMLTGASNKDIELLLVLYEYRMEENVNRSGVSTFHFDGEFFGGRSGKYAYLEKVDSVYEVISGRTETKNLQQLAAVKTSALLARYTSRQLKREYPLSEQEVTNRRREEKLKHPLYQTRVFKKGIYYTVDQFLANEPVDTPFIKSVAKPWDGKTEVYFYYPNAKGKKGKQVKGNTYFAIYDGEQWSVPGDFFAYPMTVENGDFYRMVFVQSALDKTNANGATAIVVAASLAGGIIGGAIAAATTTQMDNAAEWTAYWAKFDPETKTFVPQKRLN